MDYLVRHLQQYLCEYKLVIVRAPVGPPSCFTVVKEEEGKAEGAGLLIRTGRLWLRLPGPPI